MIRVGTGQRSTQRPSIPTISESGVPGFEAMLWDSFADGPEVIAKINSDPNKIFSDPTLRERSLVAQGLQPILGSPQQFSELIRSETIR